MTSEYYMKTGGRTLTVGLKAGNVKIQTTGGLVAGSVEISRDELPFLRYFLRQLEKKDG